MRSTFQNSGMSLSIGIFFSLMVAGPGQHAAPDADRGAAQPGGAPGHRVQGGAPAPGQPLFAALLGYNPIHNLLGPTGVLNHLSAKQVGVLTGKQFFPSVISGPFHHGLVIVFTAAAIMSFIGAMVSLLRGKQFYYDEGSGAGQVTAATRRRIPAGAPPAWQMTSRTGPWADQRGRRATPAGPAELPTR